MLELEHCFRVKQVWWALAPPLVLTANSEATVGVSQRCHRIGSAVALLIFVSDDLESYATENGGGASEVLGHEVFAQSHCLKSLSSGIGSNGRDPHLAHDFQNALAQSLDHVVNRSVDVNSGNHALVDQVFDALHRQVGVNSGSAKPNHERNVVHFADIAGLHNEADLHTLLTTNQMVVHC